MGSVRALSERQLLTVDETHQFLKDCFCESNSSSDLMKPVYEREFDQIGHKSQQNNERQNTLLTDSSIDEKLWEIVTLANQHRSGAALRKSKKLLNVEPYDPKLLQWHISLLVENDEAIELFKIGHRLIGKFLNRKENMARFFLYRSGDRLVLK